jgi:hypothetical protein
VWGGESVASADGQARGDGGSLQEWTAGAARTPL